jgi:hypothetical protein
MSRARGTPHPGYDYSIMRSNSCSFVALALCQFVARIERKRNAGVPPDVARKKRALHPGYGERFASGMMRPPAAAPNEMALRDIDSASS